MTTPVPPPPKRAGRPPKPPAELYSAEHRVRVPRAQLERWQAAAKARGVRLADWTRATLDAAAASEPPPAGEYSVHAPQPDDLGAAMSLCGAMGVDIAHDPHYVTCPRCRAIDGILDAAALVAAERLREIEGEPTGTAEEPARSTTP